MREWGSLFLERLIRFDYRQFKCFKRMSKIYKFLSNYFFLHIIDVNIYHFHFCNHKSKITWQNNMKLKICIRQNIININLSDICKSLGLFRILNSYSEFILYIYYLNTYSLFMFGYFSIRTTQRIFNFCKLKI